MVRPSYVLGGRAMEIVHDRVGPGRGYVDARRSRRAEPGDAADEERRS